ncbi:TspO protein [Salinibacter sp. 10B]|uniref:TspO/MBR family protein n=1 Tax=Salinibacter sp. 10B TaxID=1923971 RepID=UPI000CF3D608|nr:TspO/MBR family protein [Salinibacter sp. 10B]PQJ33323.1 TspO protein [Salinibacter sp. 10B]
MPRSSRWTLPPWSQAVLAVLACEAVGLLAGWGTQASVRTWYPTLVKPSFTPPGWLFAPVWTVLYALMGIAAFLVWKGRTEDTESQQALVLFAGQLVLNGAWSFAFFGARSPILGLIVITALWGMVVWTTDRFFRVRRVAGALLVPYLAWVTYAWALNVGIWLLN